MRIPGGAWKAALGFVLLAAGCRAHAPAPRSKESAWPGRVSRASELPAPVPGWKKAYLGPGGVRLDLVRLEDGTFLARVSGTTSPIEGKVLRCRMEVSGARRAEWSFTYRGRKFVLLVERRVGALVRYWLGVPGRARSLAVVYDEAASQAVEPKRLAELHAAQVASGELAAVERFDAEAAKRSALERLSRHVDGVARRCGRRLAFRFDWQSLGTVTPDSVRLVRHCGAGLSALENLCRAPGAAEVVARNLDGFLCRIGPGPKFGREGRTLTWTVPKGFHYLVGSLERLLANEVRWEPDGVNLATVIFDNRVEVCTDGKGRFLGFRPNRERERMDKDFLARRSLFYGSKSGGMRLVPSVRGLGEGWFFDPRYPEGDKKRTFRGLKMAYYSRAQVDREHGTCSLRCGTRRVALRLLPRAEAAALLRAKKLAPPLARRVPYGLARDRRGIYYFVDRAPGAEKRDFRLYRGKLGRLRRLKMTNIVTDSEGDVFSTRDGSLRLVLERDHSYWIRKRRKQVLVNVPIQENLDLVYGPLGVYEGQPFGTPCDIF